MFPRTRHYADEEDRLLDRLLHAHGYTPASARSFIQKLRDLAFRTRKVSHKPGQIVASGVSETEPPGRNLAEAHLLMVALDYVAPEDWGLVNRISPQGLKWEHIKRLCTQAYQQGVILSLAGLAYLVGLVVDAVQNRIVAEMSLSGMSIQEIARRIFRSLEEVDQYVKSFDGLPVLRHFGLPKKLMVQVTGHSLSLIEEHLPIADKHFPTAEALTQCLTSRGVDLEEAG